MYLPLCSNTYDDVTDFKICGFHKNQKILNSIKKIINYKSKATFMAKISFIECRGNLFSQKLSHKVSHCIVAL